MNDEHNQNDPIERLFREKADEYDISYREEDWLKLEKQLDTRDMKLYYQRRMRWLAAASILILSLIGYYTIQNHNQINQLTEQLHQNETVQQNEQSASESTLAEEATDQTQDETNREEAVTGEREEFDTNTRTASQESQEQMERLIAAREESEEVETEEDDSFAFALQTIERKPVDPAPLYSNQNSEVILTGNIAEPVRITDGSQSEPFDTEVYDSGSGSITLFEGGSSEDQPFTSAMSRLAVGVVVSPDLSTVGAVSNFYDPGFKGGVMAEYALTKNISLVTGAAISNVKYKAAGREYNPPYGWNHGKLPDQAAAVCMVLDIPLGIKANIINFGQSRFFATAGISSYIMLNEEYQFSYDGDATDLETSWSEKTGTKHWLSNAGFSVGFEYDLSPNWSLRAEPHIKVPLKGVGWGDVKLYSMGSFLSINYRFDR